MNTGAIPKTTNRDVYGSAYAPYDGTTTPADTALQTQAPTLYESRTASVASTRAGNDKFLQSTVDQDLPTPSERCFRDNQKLTKYMMHIHKKYGRNDHVGVQRSVDRLNRYFRDASLDIKNKETASNGLGQQEARLFQITSRDLKMKIDEMTTQFELWGYNVQRYDWPTTRGTLNPGNPRRMLGTHPTPTNVTNAITPVTTAAPPQATQVRNNVFRPTGSLVDRVVQRRELARQQPQQLERRADHVLQAAPPSQVSVLPSPRRQVDEAGDPFADLAQHLQRVGNGSTVLQATRPALQPRYVPREVPREVPQSDVSQDLYDGEDDSESSSDHVRDAYRRRRRHHRPAVRTARAPRTESPPPPEETHPREQFYFDLPAPWNVTPHKSYRKGYDVAKAVPGKIVPIFDGTAPSYFAWRAAFIQNIHPVYFPLVLKIQILKETLNTKDLFLKKVASSLEASPAHYRLAIESLEETYGNPEKMVMGLVNNLCNQAPVKENNHGSLFGLVQELNSIRMTLEQSNLLNTFNSPLMLQAAMSLFPPSIQCKYHDWMQDFHPEERPSLETLITFGKRQARTLSRTIPYALSVLPKSMSKPSTQHVIQVNDHVSRAPDLLSKSPDDEPTLTRHVVQDNSYDSGSLDLLSKSSDDKLANLSKDFSLVELNEDDDPESEQVYVVRLSPKCPLCSGQAHLYRACPKFLKLSPQERRAHLISVKKCFRCFREGHNLSSCKSNLTCKTCKEKHNTLVCLKGKTFEVQNTHQAAQLGNRGPPASLPIVAVLLENPDTHKTVLTNALLDTGAQRTFIAEHLRTKLALTGHAEPYHSVGFGGVKTTFDYSVSCVVRIFSLDRVFNALIKTSTLPDPIGDLYPEKFETDVHNQSSLKDLKMAPVLADVKVDMIIGSDNAIALQSKRPDVLLPNGTMAKHSMFGYVLMGTRSLDVLRQGVARENEKLSTLNELDPLFVRSYRVSTETKPLTHLEKAGRIYDRSLMDLLERMHTLDNVDDELPMSLEDKYAFNNLTKSIRWTGQRFEASCLWKRNEPCLSNNRNAAIKRLDNALRNPKFKSVSAPVYNSTIADNLEKGYIKRIQGL
jgi:hypothetical protein